MELLSLSSSSTQGFWSSPPADHGWRSWPEPVFVEDQNILCSWLFLSQKDEAFWPETLRMLLQSVGGSEERSSQWNGFTGSENIV